MRYLILISMILALTACKKKEEFKNAVRGGTAEEHTTQVQKYVLPCVPDVYVACIGGYKVMMTHSNMVQMFDNHQAIKCEENPK